MKIPVAALSTIALALLLAGGIASATEEESEKLFNLHMSDRTTECPTFDTQSACANAPSPNSCVWIVRGESGACMPKG